MERPPDRQCRARELCRRLTEEVASVSPEGLGSWVPDKHPVHVASLDFLEALGAWERDEGSIDQVREAHDQAVRAWRGAAEAFKQSRGERRF